MPALSSHANVQQLAALMLAHGVTRCVLCPGSRNAPLSATFAVLPGMECRRATDERSAGFLACGWAARCGAPVAVCVTSGSALLNLHPAVAEAFYRHLPLLVISADRPPAAIGQQLGQTLPQPAVFGPLVHAAADLPEGDAAHANRLLNEALLALRHRGGGPVHINVPLTEPLFGMVEAPLPAVRVIRRTELARMDAAEEESLLATVDALPRRLILLGQLPAAPALPPELSGKGFALVGEHLCNAAPKAQTRPDLLLPAAPAAEWSPDLLITFGGCVISKKLQAQFRAHPPREHWHVGADGAVIDPYGCLTRVIEGDPAEFRDLLAAFADEGDAAYAARWQQDIPSPSFPAASGMGLTRSLMAALPAPSVLHLANSSAVRYAQLFPLPPGVQVECNRGVNGIEGSLSTAIGYAQGDARLNVLLIGDLSFFYDMNALWLPGTRGNLRVLLLNNGTGGIFATLPGMPDAPAVQGPHAATARDWAQAMGWCYLALRTEADIPAALAALTTEGASPLLVEAFTDAAQDAALLRQFRES